MAGSGFAANPNPNHHDPDPVGRISPVQQSRLAGLQGCDFPINYAYLGHLKMLIDEGSYAKDDLVAEPPSPQSHP